MKIERWKEENDEEWAVRLAEEIVIANNTEVSKYFVERDPRDEKQIIINYVQEGLWTWKEHPEGPFKATQIIEWKNKAAMWDEFRNELTFYNWSCDDMIKCVTKWGNDSFKLMEIENEQARKVQSSCQTTRDEKCG